MTRTDALRMFAEAFTSADLAVRLTESTRGRWSWSAEDAAALLDWVADQLADEDEADVWE